MDKNTILECTKTLNNKTKQAKNYIQYYKYYFNKNRQDIYNIYKKPSQAKINAFEYCLKVKDCFNATKGIILGANCMQFTYAFLYTEQDNFTLKDYDNKNKVYKQVNLKNYLFIITKDNFYRILVSESIFYNGVYKEYKNYID